MGKLNKLECKAAPTMRHEATRLDTRTSARIEGLCADGVPGTRCTPNTLILSNTQYRLN
jgi:hypothetical protein